MMQTSVECSVGDRYCAVHGWGPCACTGCPQPYVVPWQQWTPTLPTLSYEDLENRRQMLALALAMAALIEAGVRVEEIEIVIGLDHSTIVRKRVGTEQGR